MNSKNICILGSGAWGTALAKHVHRMGHKTTIWCRRNEKSNEINNTHNNYHLDGINLKGINATNDLNCTKNSDIIIIAIPSQNIRQYIQQIKVKNDIPIIICSKGIELDSLKLISEIITEYLPNTNPMVLSGPTFAIEVANQLPTTVTLAGKNSNIIAKDLITKYFRIYPSSDIIGTEITGTVKNIIAIATGIAVAKKIGDNAKASIITRALEEIKQLIISMGGQQNTILQPCGIGDLILTCSSEKSRNMSFGIELGNNKTTEQILKQRTTITEGVINSKTIFKLSQKYNISMPICEAIFKIIHQEYDIDKAIYELLNRPIKNI